jgi:hypothetical protein
MNKAKACRKLIHKYYQLEPSTLVKLLVEGFKFLEG